MSVKTTTKDWIKTILQGSGVLRLANSFTASRAIILGYHSVQDHPEFYTNSIGLGISHATSDFEDQMKLIAREYTPVSLEEILVCLRGETRLAKKVVAVTFDDGYRDNCEIAEPILRRYGIPATFYLTSSWIGTSEVPWFCRLRYAFATTQRDEWSDPVVGQRWKLVDPKSRNAALQIAFDICSSMNGDVCKAKVRTIEQDLDVTPLALETDLMMTWDQARKLRRAGHIIGSHTTTHPNVAHLKDEAIVRNQLIESKREIEKELNESVLHFSYPHPALYPQWTERTMEITREAEYQTAVTTTVGPVHAGDNPLLLRRLMAPRHGTQFRWELDSTFLGLVS